MHGRVSYNDDLFFLKKYSSFSPDSFQAECVTFSYAYEKHDELRCFMPLDLFDNTTEKFQHMVKLMIWVHNYLIPGEDAIPIHPFNCINILEKTKSQQIQSNCWMYATVLNELFLNFGYKSRMIRCMPLDLRFNDCHCVVQAYVEEYSKWVVFDAALGTYYADELRRPLCLQEMRERAVSEQKIITSLLPAKYSKEIQKYWIKNLFRFETYSESKFNIEEDRSERLIIYSLLPAGYELKDNEYIYNQRKMRIINIHNDVLFWRG